MSGHRSTEGRHAEEVRATDRLEACGETRRRPSRRAFHFGALARFTALATGLVAAVIGLSAVVFAVTEEAPAALVFGLRSMPEGLSLLTLDGPMATVGSDRPGYVGRLYAAGALLVLPVRRNGCLGASADQRLASVAIRSATAASTVPISQR